jgi:hypothetical protein
MSRYSLAACAALLAVGAQAAPHQHGVIALNFALDGATLTIEVKAPLDSLVGWERAPRNDAERRAAAEALERLRDPARLFTPDAAAQCSAAVPQVDAGLLAPDAKPAAGEHADLQASYRYTCAQPTQLRAIALPIFDAFKRIQRIEVQAVGPQGQRKSTLRRANSLLKLAP